MAAEKISETKDKPEPVPAPAPSRGAYYRQRPWHFSVLGILIVVLVLLLVGSVFHNRHESTVFGNPGGRTFNVMGGGQGHRFRGGAGGLNSQNRISGVVTAVNGSSFTLAGQGSSTQVQTDSSTQYQGGNQVKVNDSVIAFGTTSNGTFTATEVAINP